MEADMREKRRATRDMGRESFIIRKEATTMGSGRTTTCMGKANFITPMERSPTMASGCWINSMAREK